MSDLICRKSMMRCQTPGMCSPHGGCQPSALIETNVSYSSSSGATMTDHAEVIELCKIAQHQGGPQNMSAVGIGRYLRLCSPELVLGLFSDIEKLAAQVRLAGVSAEMTVHQAVGRAASDYLVAVFERDQLKSEVEVLRKHAPSAEINWCACGDGYPANSYGAGFMAANNGVCENCDAANGGVEPDLDTLRKDADRYRWLRDGAGYYDTREIPGMAPARMDAFIDAAMSNEAGHE